MTQYAYSPDTGEMIRTDTGELIRTDNPSDWMGLTDVVPPEFDPATAGCFWRGDHWEIVVATPVPGPTYQQLRAARFPSITMLADGIVKQHSPDPLVAEEGNKQVAEYAALCLAVKAEIPKE